MKTTFKYDHYYDYATIKEYCTFFAKTYPDLVKMETILTTAKQKDVLAMTLTNQKTGNALAKPAIYIDANTHAGEVCGSMAAMHTMDYLLTNYAEDLNIKQLLDEYTFYIIALKQDMRLATGFLIQFQEMKVPKGISIF